MDNDWSNDIIVSYNKSTRMYEPYIASNDDLLAEDWIIVK